MWTRFPALWTLILTHRDDLLRGDGKHEGVANEGQGDRARQVVEVAVAGVPQQVGNGCLLNRTNFVQCQLNYTYNYPQAYNQLDCKMTYQTHKEENYTGE